MLGVAAVPPFLAPGLRLDHGLAAGCLAPWLGETPPARRLGPASRALLAILLAAACAGLARGLELAAVEPDPQRVPGASGGLRDP